MTTPAESPYLPGNPYIRMMELSGEHMPPEVGAVYATLALAYEQRTATLLAVTNKQYLPGANDQVKQRLGWPEGVEPPTPKDPAPKDLHAAEVYETAVLEVEAALSAGLKSISYGEDREGTSDGFSRIHVHVDGTVDVKEVTRKIVDALRLRGCL